jgi:hypothetical protein
MINKSGFLLISAVSAIILTACNTGRINSFEPLQENMVTQQSTEKENKFNTAKDSLWIAEGTARRWDISADLVKVEGRYVYEDGSSTWTYYFKSPFKQKVLRVDFTGNGQEIPNGFFGSDIMAWDWNLDSNQAIVKAKEQGLKDFPVLEMTLERKFSNAEWELRTYNGIFRVDAQTGKLLSKTQK